MSHAAESSVMSAKIGEEVLPVAQRAGGECGDEGAAERRDRLDDLPAVSELVSASPLDHVGEQRVERHLRIVLPMPSSTNAVMHVARL